MVFVTGATGFLGSYVCLYLSQKGYTIKASKRKHSKIPSFLQNLPIQWVDVDLLDFFALKDELEGCEAIFHCAAVVSFLDNDKKSMWQNNVDLTSNIVNVALDLGNIHLIHVSSIAAVGEAKPGKLIDENCRWVHKKSDSDYAITKFEAEREVWRGIHEGLKAVIVNPSVILGYDERNQGSMAFLDQVKNGLRFYTPGMNGFVDVNDVSKCMISLYEQGIHSERFVISAGNHSFKKLLDTIAHKMNTKAPSILVSKWMMKMAVMFIQLFNKKHPLNRHTLSAGFNKSEYSNKKILDVVPTNFIALETSIENMLNKKIN